MLEKYVTSPQAVVPGTKMGYPGQKEPQKRADMIAYLQRRCTRADHRDGGGSSALGEGHGGGVI